MEFLNAKVETLTTKVKEGGIVTVDKNASLPDVLEILSKHDIRSVPLVDKSDNDRLVGVVDMVDVIAFIVQFVEECHKLPATSRTFEWFSEQLKKSGQTILQIAESSQKNKLIPVKQGASILDIMKIMATNSVQRVPILDAHDKLEHFVTQSAFIQYFAKNSDKLGKYGECTLAELGFHSKPVISVKDTALAIDAFKLMGDHKITGIPILDSEGTIITNISSKDLRIVLSDPHFFEKLQYPVEKFVSDLKSKIFLHDAETMYPKICCKFSSKFNEILHKLAATKIHRIYVVDAFDHPVGIISLHDIVAKILEMNTKNEVQDLPALRAHD